LHTSLVAWKKGAEVFKNIGCSGDTDLVISHKGHLLKCDVKVMTKRGRNYYAPQIGRVAPGVYMIAVHPITHQISWHPKTVPAGLENFWEK
jgi:hypothetical protein